MYLQVYNSITQSVLMNRTNHLHKVRYVDVGGDVAGGCSLKY